MNLNIFWPNIIPTKNSINISPHIHWSSAGDGDRLAMSIEYTPIEPPGKGNGEDPRNRGGQ